MSETQDNAAEYPQRIIEALRRERDSALAEKSALVEALARRDSAYSERIEQQAATIDVLKAMSASPADPQPVFDRIAAQAQALCGGAHVGLFEFDGTMVHCRAAIFHNAPPDVVATYIASFPIPADREPDLSFAIALREGRVVHIRDTKVDQGISSAGISAGLRSAIAVPLLRDGAVIGLMSLARYETGGMTDAQVELLKTFAEQAVIAITSAETYRALQTRTADLRESLKYQTATSDVLKVISRSAFDLDPALENLLVAAARLCDADSGTISTVEGDHTRTSTNYTRDGSWGLSTRRGDRYPIARSSIIGRTVIEARVIHVEDVGADPGHFPPGLPPGSKLSGTMLGVPLLRDGAVIGVIRLARDRVQPFSDRQIDLVTTFADQAVIAIENTRLITETREALERQTATAEVLQVINANPGDPGPVFDAILESAHRVCGASIGSLWLYDGELTHAVATRGMTEEDAAVHRRPSPMSPAQRTVLIDGARYFHSADRRFDGVELSSDIVAAGVQTVLGVPLVKDGRAIGVIGARRLEARPFADREIELLESFAAQAVIAMENARLLTETREALEQQTATAEVLGVINANPGDLAPVFDAMLEKAMRLCEAAFGGMSTWDGELVRTVASRGFPPAFETYIASRGSTAALPPMARRMMETKLPMQIADVRDGEGYRNGHPDSRAVVDLGGARTLLYVPLLKDEICMGYLTVYRRERRLYSDKEIALLENFAAQAVIAMENAHLLGELRERTAALTARDAENTALIARQAASIEVLQAISESPGDAQPVLELILRHAAALTNAQTARYVEYDGTLLHQRAVAGLERDPEVEARFLTHWPRPPGPETVPGRVILAGGPVHIPDHQSETEIFQPGRALGARAYYAMPLLHGGRIIGVLILGRYDPGEFDRSAIELVQSFAGQAVIALSSAAALKALRERTADLQEALEQQTATAEVLGVINANPGDLAPVFDAILEKALRICSPAFGSLASFDGPGINFLAARGETPALTDYRARNPYPGPSPNMLRAIETKRPYQLLDIRDGEGYRSGHPSSVAVADLGGARSLLLVPLLKDQTVIGRIQIYRQEVRAFSDKEVALLENFAAQAVIAMENARLITEIRAARDSAETSLRELKIAQANLVQAEKMASLGQLTAGIAHEIKNPLNFVNNFAALSVDLLKELKEAAAPGFATLTEDQRADIDDVSAMLTTNLRKITEHGKRADGIVKAMLEHSRGSSGERREVDLNALVDEALNLAYHGARAQDQSFNITLERDFATGIAPIELNPQEMTRVFLNMFSNGFYAANKRAKEGAEPGFEPILSVSTRAVNDAVEIRIRDNGTGIPADIRDKLFQPFFTTKPTGEGTGLGLSITYDIVTKAHGGTITVESEVGAFTEFVVTLPRHMFAGEGGRS